MKRTFPLDGSVCGHLIPIHLGTSALEPVRYWTSDEGVNTLGIWFHWNNHQILMAPGVDELIRRLLPILASNVDGVMMAFPTYPFYRSLCEVMGIPFEEVVTIPCGRTPTGPWPPDPERSKRKLVILVNPENPTGTILPRHRLLEAIANAPSALFLVDESYIDYRPEETLLNDVQRFPNLIVLRGFSKGLGLPGLRIGAGITSNSDVLKDYWQEYFLMSISGTAVGTLNDILSSKILRRALAFNRFFRRWQTKRIAKAMERLSIPAHPTSTNLIFAHLPRKHEERIAEAFEKRGIICTRPGHHKWLDKYYAPLTENQMSYFRLSCGIGTRQVVKALRDASR